MEKIQQFIQLLEEQIRLMKNLIKAFEIQQKALIRNDLTQIQESTLQQADLIEAIARTQDSIHHQIEEINKEYGVSIATQSFRVLQGKIGEANYRKLLQLLDLHKVYGMEIEEYQKNNQVLLENALRFVQAHKQLLKEFMTSKPVYDFRKTRDAVNVNHIISKKA